jgi:alkanesulfonate monooxygenase
VDGAGLPPALAATEFPEIYFSGSSDAAIAAAGRHSDYYLSWLEPFADLRAKFEQVAQRSELEGRVAKFAVRVDLLARPTEEEAWADARSAWDAIDPKAREAWYFAGGGGDSVGAARQAGFRMNSAEPFDELIIAPNLWAGFSLLRPGPSIGIVGDYANAAERLNDLIELGVDAFILAGSPHLEEAYRVGEEVLPLVRPRSRTAASLVTV